MVAGIFPILARPVILNTEVDSIVDQVKASFSWSLKIFQLPFHISLFTRTTIYGLNTPLLSKQYDVVYLKGSEFGVIIIEFPF